MDAPLAVQIGSPVVQDLVVVVDLSSSMMRVPSIVAAINSYLARVPETTRLSLVTFNSEVLVVARNKLPSQIPRFSEARWNYHGPNCHLAQGSKLRKAISDAAALAASSHAAGRSAGVLVLTDGWSTGDAGYVPMAKLALRMMRGSAIKFAMFAFIEQRTRLFLDRLISELGLTADEVVVLQYLGDHDRSDVADRTVNVMTERSARWTGSRNEG